MESSNRRSVARTVRVRRRGADSSRARVYQDARQEDRRDDWGSIARMYDLEHPAVRGAELRFWNDQAKLTAGQVLELAAGSGRIGIALARKGHAVTGLELSEGMLDRARSRTAHLPPAAHDRLTWVQGDMGRLDLGAQRFGLIFVAYNSFWLLPTEELQSACLVGVRQHLAPGGRFVLDVFPPVEDDFQDEKGIAQRLAMAARGRAIVRVKDYTYDASNCLAVSHVRYYGERRGRNQETDGRVELMGEFRYSLRIAPPEEVQDLLERNGFTVQEIYGSYEKDPLEAASPRAIFVCEVISPRGREDQDAVAAAVR